MASLQQQLNAALARHGQGDLDEAAALYRDLLAEHPEHPDALHMLGVIAQQKGNPELALKLAEAALAKKPGMAFAWHNRGVVLRTLGRTAEALQSEIEAVTLDPSYGEAWNHAGVLAADLKDHARAKECHARALALSPHNARFINDYALFLRGTGDLTGAFKAVDALVRRDNEALPLTLANTLKAAGYPARALPYYARSRAMLPGNAEIRVTEALTHLQTGDFEQGFALWETRPEIDKRFAAIPLWRGEAVDHLLLYEEQGFGDALQMARYVSLLRGRARRITLLAAPSLQKLFAASFPDANVIAADAPMPQATARARLMSLPALLGTRLENIPADIPYLKALEEGREPWRARLAKISKPRIGIVWAGNPDNRNEQQRSLAFADLAPLVQNKAHLISLQKGAQKTGADLAGIFDAEPWLDDFAASAGLLCECDLLISADTAALHLAGALGIPAWGLIPFDPDWRWLLAREDSPWYPTLRLFRQKAPRDWASVVARVAEDVRKFLAGDRSALTPLRWQGPPSTQNPDALDLGASG